MDERGPVGTWSVDHGVHTFRYDPRWLESPRRRSLSLSIPLTGTLEVRGEVVRNYFDNLLPDNDRVRARLRNRFKLKDAKTFDLLEAIGRDCVGAVQLLPEGAAPQGWNAVNCEPLDEEQIAALLQAVPSEDTPEGMRDEDLFRISLAGAQEKTALTFWNGEWCRPHGATPTTHIIKLPLGLIGGSKRVDASDSVQNEWLCAQIVEALGLQVAPTSMATFGGQTVLVVERFDREWMDGGAWIARLPQEDCCQAMGLPSDRKYEQHGGPGMSKCLQLLQGSGSAEDGARFLLAQLAFFLLAATDGHAKNFSIHLLRGDAYEMTPLYDIISMWPYFGNGPNQFQPRKAGLAMAIRSKNAHYVFHTIQARHWHGLAMKNGGIDVWNAMLDMAASVDDALSEVEALLPSDFPAWTWESISRGMRSEAERFLSGVTDIAV
ncbi:HipA domain-containing protein [Variovorax sp. CF313]|uniref:type II toxin-antitoxin system HipA family toxin n=1 Tax=Variovorax sp. CF313 TaxID=1144315 RepID=UPI000270DBE6|nr:HipA domain-containing protein [Variovorax sp. CF313]